MKTPKGQIAREGVVSFGDASLAVWEEGIPREWDLKEKWGHQFKREVFARIAQTLNRLGWTVTIPPTKQNSPTFTLGFRDCSKGDLKGELSISGRHIEFKTWQGVNTPTRPDHGGRYESDLEGCMPYVLRLEMERTRCRIRDYLCNVFSDYTFDHKIRSIYRKPLQFTAMEVIQQRYAESWHFKGVDWDKRKAEPGMSYNLKAGDGQPLEHGQRVWTTDWSGRWVEGIALYNINNMWWVVLGRYDYTNKACFDLRTTPPPDVRTKQNERHRRKRLECLLADAVKAMNFKRTEVLKGVLFPKPEPLFMIQCVKDGLYFAPDYCGYRRDQVDAGKYTEAELKPYASGIRNGKYKAVQISL